MNYGYIYQKKEQYINDKSYTGWYFGAGYLDRICAYGIQLLFKNKFDGISSKSGFLLLIEKVLTQDQN